MSPSAQQPQMNLAHTLTTRVLRQQRPDPRQRLGLPTGLRPGFERRSRPDHHPQPRCGFPQPATSQGSVEHAGTEPGPVRAAFGTLNLEPHGHNFPQDLSTSGWCKVMVPHPSLFSGERVGNHDPQSVPFIRSNRFALDKPHQAAPDAPFPAWMIFPSSSRRST